MKPWLEHIRRIQSTLVLPWPWWKIRVGICPITTWPTILNGVGSWDVILHWEVVWNGWKLGKRKVKVFLGFFFDILFQYFIILFIYFYYFTFRSKYSPILQQSQKGSSWDRVYRWSFLCCSVQSSATWQFVASKVSGERLLKSLDNSLTIIK